MIVITGWRSQIAIEFRKALPVEEAAMPGSAVGGRMPKAGRYLFCQGLLRPKQATEQSDAEIAEGVKVNYSSIVRACREIFAENDAARVCIIGSESGYRGSFDGVYAAAKMALHRFVETERLKPRQQLVAISPGIVSDAGMTIRRNDLDNLERRRAEHPKGRFLTSREVAEVAYFALYGASDYLSGTIIRLHGGLP